MRTFAFATYADPGGSTIGAVVLDPTGEAITVALADLELPWTGSHTVDAILEDWDDRFTTVAERVDDLASPRPLDVATLRVMAPVRPPQIHQAGANYRSHVVQLVLAERADTDPEELRPLVEAFMDDRKRAGAPYVFPGMVSALCGAEDDIVLPVHGAQPDWELELAAVIGQRCWRVDTNEARSFVAGYTMANDLTLRDLVYRTDIPQMGTDWLRGKNAPTFLPVGPLFVPAAFVDDPMDLTLTLRLNGETMQHETTAGMLFDVDDLVAYVSGITTMLPGDLLLTGSPAGNGAHHGRYLEVGDLITASISGLGEQRNRCVAEPMTGPRS